MAVASTLSWTVGSAGLEIIVPIATAEKIAKYERRLADWEAKTADVRESSTPSSGRTRKRHRLWR